MRAIIAILCGALCLGLGHLPCWAESIEVAAIYALTGEAADANAPSVEGVRLGVDEINRRGGILGKSVELKVLDNQSTPIGSYIAAQEAADSAAVVIIGAAWSTHSLPMAQVAQNRGIPMISSYSTNPAVTQAGNYIFRVCFTDTFQGVALAHFARYELKASTATVMINLNSDYSIGLAKIFRGHFEDLGGQVVCELEYKSKQKQFDDQIQQAKQAQGDVLFLSGHDESGLLGKLAQDAGVGSIPLGGDGWDEPSFLAKGGAQLKRAYFCSHWSETEGSELSRAFVAKYRDVPGLGAGTALAYDAVMVWADAVKRAGSCERSKVRAALAATRAFEGVTGTISFDGQGNPVKNLIVMEIRDGRPFYLKTLNPSELGYARVTMDPSVWIAAAERP